MCKIPSQEVVYENKWGEGLGVQQESNGVHSSRWCALAAVCHAQCMFIGLAKGEMRPKTSHELIAMSGRISVRVTKQYNTVQA